MFDVKDRYKVYETVMDSVGLNCKCAAVGIVNVSGCKNKDQIKQQILQKYNKDVNHYAKRQEAAIEQNQPIEPIVCNSAKYIQAMCTQMVKLGSTAF